MLRVDGYDAVHRFRHLVDTENLQVCGVVGFCFDETVDLQLIKQRTRDGISQRQLEHAVTRLGHDAGHGFFQKTDGGFILHENRDQIVSPRCCRIGPSVVYYLYKLLCGRK